MNKNDINKKYLNILKHAVLVILFCTALYFENAGQQRLIILIAVFLIILLNNIFKPIIKENNIFFWSFLLDILLVYILENNSRLLINYFLHSFYIIIIIEACFNLELSKGIIVGIITIFVSMIKYAFLIYYKFNLSSFSQMAFFLMVNILIMVTATFAQYNKREKDKKDILYKELLDAHKKLKEYNDELNRLSVMEERNRIARDIHDTLGHNMTALIMQLQMMEHYIDKDVVKSEELLENSIKTSRNSLIEIRKVVETLRGREALALPYDINNLIKEFSEKTGAFIELKCNGDASSATFDIVNNVLYHIIQESLTNAIRHGNATKIDVLLNYEEDAIKFNIKDNGDGAANVNINEGYGLKGIRERVQSFKGVVEYGSDNGFYINGIIYLEGKNDKIIVS